jgi:predicted lipid-binding transport protein (Tim44 family)
MQMQRLFTLALTAFLVFALPYGDAEAKRLGGGLNLGKQTSSYSRSSTTNTTKSSSTATQSATRSGASRWLGPLAGLAAGGLLAALLFGDGFEGFQMLDFLLIAGLLLLGFKLFRTYRQNAGQAQPAGPYGSPGNGFSLDQGPASGSLADSTDSAPTQERPAWFDAQSFVTGAKTHFIRLQAAWDKGDLRDIREYTTPELFAELQMERMRLGQETHYTEVMTLNAELAGIQREADQVVASIRFSGLIQEAQGAQAQNVSEIWNVVHDWDSPDGDWLIAGIQQDAQG